MAALAIILFFLLLGMIVFFLALRGGRGPVTEAAGRPSRGARRLRVTGMVVLYAAFGLAVPVIVLAADNGHDRNAIGGVHLTAAEARGRVLFGRTCNECHTLAAARTVGRVGPNLDQLQPPKSLVLDAIAHGRARGNGRMPIGLLQGRDAQDVADFVSTVAGK
jgi:mono/diheme cytochrome c family protein